jgi:transglutaminase-like putative cysteine protease
MLRLWILFISTLAFALHSANPSAAANWKPVTLQELKMTAEALGDPDADAAILFREGELNDTSVDGTSLKIYIRIKIFNDRGRRYAEVQLPYRVELGRVSDVHARTIRPDGSPIEVEPRDIFDKVVLRTNRGIWRAKVFTMPAVEAGAIIEYRYRQTYPQGFRYFALDLQSDLFIKELHYSIQPPISSKLDVRWVTFNAPDPRRFAPTWDGSFDIRADNIPAFRREPLMPPELGVKMWGWLYYSRDVDPSPERYWREYAERRHHRISYETKPTRAIRHMVETITLARDGPGEKIARIYDYVQSEIHNLKFKDERNTEAAAADPGLKKNKSVEDTIRRRYGSPSDINLLFISMLRAAGLDARLAELTTRDENFFHRSFPDAFQLNSELTAVLARDGSVQFFDPGTPSCPPGMLSWEKEGTTALVYGEADWRFVETPVSDASLNAEERVIRAAALPDGTLQAHVELKIAGQRALELRGRLADQAADEQSKQLLRELRALLPAAQIDDASVTFSNPKNTGKPVIASYDFKVPQLAERTETRLLVRPALLSHRDEGITAAPARTNSIYFPHPWSEIDRVVIEAPAGYKIEELPGSVVLDIGAAHYQASYVREGECVVYQRRLVVNTISMSVDQYPVVRAFFDRVLQADRAAVSFKQLP